MVRNVQSLLKITSNVLKTFNTQQIWLNGSRTLYSAHSLGLDGYKQKRDTVQQQFNNMSDKFREKMRAYISEESKNLVFTEDLKNMLHLVNNQPEDMELLLKMMVKFNKQNKELRFGSYIFGPVIMRTYYYLDEVDEALAAFYNPELAGLFDNVTTCQILMDLLYNHERYTDLRKVFETVIASKPIYETGFYPRSMVVLILGGCYKENTPESFEYALNLWQKLKEKSHTPMRRACTFLAGLALNHGKPDIALEVLYNIQRGNYITMLNLKVASLADLNRFDDILQFLRTSLIYDNPTMPKQNYTADTIEKVNQAIRSARSDEADAIVRAIAQLKEGGHIIETPLDKLITTEIVGDRFQGRKEDNLSAYDRNEFQSRNPNDYQSRNRDDFRSGNRQTRRPYMQSNNFNQRPGLKELL